MSEYMQVEAEKLTSLMDQVSSLITAKSTLIQLSESSLNAEFKKVAEEIEVVSSHLQDTAIQLNQVLFSDFVASLNDHIIETAPVQGVMKLTVTGHNKQLEKTVADDLLDITSLLTDDIYTKWVGYGNAKTGELSIQQTTKPDSIEITIIDPFVHEGDYVLSNKIAIENLLAGVGGTFVRDQNLEGKERFVISVPISSSFIEGLLVSVNQVSMVIPLSSIVKCTSVTLADITENKNKTLVIDGEQIPYIHLRDRFKLGDTTPETFNLIVTRCGDKKVGFTADKIVGEYKGAQKDMGFYFEDVVHFSGATILGDGRIAVILNPTSFI